MYLRPVASMILYCDHMPHAVEVYSTVSTESRPDCNLIRMTPSSLHFSCLLATLILLLLEGIGADNSTAVYVPCEGGSNRLLQLDELVHISDVVMNGVVLTSSITQDKFGTLKAAVSYYFAYKNDSLLSRRGLASVYVVDFQERPSGESSIFFLVREPNMDLSVYCMSTLSEISRSHESVYEGLFEIVERVREVAAGQ